jgi:hypothetical protein
VCTWDGESLGGMGYAPPGFSKVLQDLGVPKNKAKETVAAVVHLLKEATKEMWEIRCYRQRAEELEVGITDDAKRDNGAASRWRAMPGNRRVRPRPGGGRGAARNRHRSEDGEEEEGGEGNGHEVPEPLITYSDIGIVTERKCGECGERTTGTEVTCRECGGKLPSRARRYVNLAVQVAAHRQDQEYWEAVADAGVTAGDDTWEALGWATHTELGGVARLRRRQAARRRRRPGEDDPGDRRVLQRVQDG